MCGDSTERADVEALMGDDFADLVVTDPPYNVDYVGETEDALTMENDSMSSAQFSEFLTRAFENMAGNLKDGGVFYVWYASWNHRIFEDALNAVGLEVREQLIWEKNTFVLGRQDYQWRHEPCLYGWKEGASHYFVDDRTQSTVLPYKGKAFEDMNREELLQAIERVYEESTSTIIKEPKPLFSRLHPTMKPLKLIGRQVQNSSKEGEIVFDPFGGSGTTLMVCEELNRECRMMEYDPQYVDVIIDRWEEYTGQKAEKVKEI